MNLKKMIKIEGFLLKAAYLIVFVIIVLIIFHLVLYINSTTKLSNELSASTGNYTITQRNAETLMDASDYLTETVQRFTVIHNPEDMDAYFDEINNVKRRENAVEDLSNTSSDEMAVEQLRKALEYSITLSESEITAIKIVCNAMGIEEKYDQVKNAKLPAECEGMTADEKIRQAQVLINNQKYYEQKMSIRNGIEGCISALMDESHRLQFELLDEINTKANYMRVFIIIQTSSLFIICLLMIHLNIMRNRRKKAIFSSHRIDMLQDQLQKLTDDDASGDTNDNKGSDTNE